MRGNIYNSSINNENTSQGKLIHPELFFEDKISPKIIKEFHQSIHSKKQIIIKKIQINI